MPMGRGGWVSGRMQYSGNVPGNEHILGLPARGMQSIFELPSCGDDVDGKICSQMILDEGRLMQLCDSLVV